MLPQLAQPIATFRYETAVPAPIDIELTDLQDYEKARRWFGMLVRVKNVTLQGDATHARESGGRLAVDILPKPASGGDTKCNAPFPKAPSLTNDLFDVGGGVYKPGATPGMARNTKVGSITGVVSFFCNVKIAPRSIADIQDVELVPASEAGSLQP